MGFGDCGMQLPSIMEIAPTTQAGLKNITLAPNASVILKLFSFESDSNDSNLLLTNQKVRLRKNPVGTIVNNGDVTESDNLG